MGHPVRTKIKVSPAPTIHKNQKILSPYTHKNQRIARIYIAQNQRIVNPITHKNQMRLNHNALKSKLVLWTLLIIRMNFELFDCLKPFQQDRRVIHYLIGMLSDMVKMIKEG